MCLNQYTFLMKFVFLSTKTVLAAVLVLLSAAAPVLAQTGATLAGTVTDVTGGALPGVTIVVRNVATGVARQTTSGDDGRFIVAGLPAGNYEVRSELNGFRPLLRSGIALTVGENAALVLKMEV